MKQVITFVFHIYSSIVRFLKRKQFFDLQNSALIIIGIILAEAILYHFFPQLGTILVTGFVVVFYSMVILFSPERDATFIKLITKNSCSTPLELFSQFTHTAFLYGLVIFAGAITFWIYYIYISICIGAGSPFYLNLIAYSPIVFVIAGFSFSFLFFCYHIYYNPSCINLDTIKLRIQQYAAILSTITFLLWCCGFDSQFKLFLSGLALVFSWLQYIISHESQQAKVNQ